MTRLFFTCSRRDDEDEDSGESSELRSSMVSRSSPLRPKIIAQDTPEPDDEEIREPGPSHKPVTSKDLSKEIKIISTIVLFFSAYSYFFFYSC